MAQNDIITALENSLNYFNNLHKTEKSCLQSHNTELFELKVKLDELNRTKNLYSMNTNYRKNVFSPIIQDEEDSERQSELENEIESLTLAKASIEEKIVAEEASLQSIVEKQEELEKAIKAAEEYDKKDDEEGKKEIEALKNQFMISEAAKRLSAKEDLKKHGQSILMLDAFEKSFFSTILDNRVIKELSSNNHKLEMLRYLITTDPEKAKTAIDNLIESDNKITETITSLLKKMHYDFDDTKSAFDLIDSYIMKFRDRHPEYVIESNIDCVDYDQKLSYIKALSLISLLEIFMDNIAKHSDATQIKIDIYISKTEVKAFIKDNGNGISEDFLNKYPWYSSLHKAYETIYLLDGELDVTGEDKIGTTIEFKYSLK